MKRTYHTKTMKSLNIKTRTIQVTHIVSTFQRGKKKKKGTFLFHSFFFPSFQQEVYIILRSASSDNSKVPRKKF